MRHRKKFAGALLTIGLGMLLAAPPAGKRALAQNASAQGASAQQGSSSNVAGNLDATLDEYQRSGQIFYMKLMGKSGAERGQHIYYLKCWICHNEYTIASDPKGHAPTLKDLYKRPKLLSGAPVNDETVTAKIRGGGPGMPSYQYGLNDQDLKDLVTYLREKCCWDADNPPANPRYKGQ
jgi:hypothetical protein